MRDLIGIRYTCILSIFFLVDPVLFVCVLVCLFIDQNNHSSGDLEGIYKDITRNTVYVVESRRTRAGDPFSRFHWNSKGSYKLLKRID